MTRERVVRHWASFLGVAAARFEEPGVRVIEHARAGLAGYAGVQVLQCGAAAWISVPASFEAERRVALGRLRAAPSVEPASLTGALGDRVERVIGPSFQGWLAPEAFTPMERAGVRPLAAGDAEALDALRVACRPSEWEHAGLSLGAPGIVGLFEGRVLAAAAALRIGASGACDPGVLTHPAHRGRGLGVAVVSAAVAPALRRGRLVLYQTLLANAPALGVARRLGFQPFGTQLAVRLRPPGSGSTSASS